jgi:hypothetical protein
MEDMGENSRNPARKNKMDVTATAHLLVFLSMAPSFFSFPFCESLAAA